MSKKICIVPVCYNAYSDAKRFLAALQASYCKCTDLHLDVLFSDNSTIPLPAEFSATHYSFDYKYIKNSNVGYFPAFSRAMSQLKIGPECYDYVVVCNVDLIVADDFLLELCKVIVGGSTGLIAPGIFSDKDGRDLNPKIQNRPKATKFKFMRFICSSVVLFSSYQKLVRLKEWLRSRSQRRRSNMDQPQGSGVGQFYGAHGSFMIFTRHYFEQGARIDYPRFLFGEEVFVAEQLRSRNLAIEHIPTLRVADKEHASTSQVQLRFICGEHKKSYDYLLKHYFDDRSSSGLAH